MAKNKQNGVCKNCNNPISEKAKICPHCGAKNVKPVYKRLWFWLLLVIVLIAAVAGGGDSGSAPEPAEEKAPLSEPFVTEEKEDMPAPEKDEPIAEDTETPGTADAPEETEEKEEEASLSMGEKNALRSAENYLKLMAFSYQGLIDQLEFEGYTTEEATYAADNCGADWFEQAAKSAENYLDIMAFSRQGLIEQLEFEGFTPEQAAHGASANGY